MAAEKRLVTYVDVDDPESLEQVSVSTRHQLQVEGGRRVLLLDDRGWGASSPWNAISAADIANHSRAAVGPDEPFGHLSTDDMAADHWEALAQTARRQGVDVDAAELKRLPHEVVLSERVLVRLRDGGGS